MVEPRHQGFSQRDDETLTSAPRDKLERERRQRSGDTEHFDHFYKGIILALVTIAQLF